MDSITKPPVSQEQLERICEKHLGAKPLLVRELKDGWFNAAFQLTLPEADFVLKIAPSDDVRVLRYEQKLMEDLKRDEQDQDIDLPQGAFESATPHLGALAEVESPALIHWDLWDPNIFVDSTSKRITGLIDFERAMWADPLMEGNFMKPSPALLDGYELAITQAPGTPARRALYDLYLSLIMVIESTYRRFPADHEKMSRDFLDSSIAALNGLR